MLRSGRSVHGTPPGSPHGLLACDSMCASPLKLPMQDMARTIKYWSAAISHVHWASQFKLSWSRQYMPPYLAERHDRGATSARQIYDIMSRRMSCAATGC